MSTLQLGGYLVSTVIGPTESSGTYYTNIYGLHIQTTEDDTVLKSATVYSNGPNNFNGKVYAISGTTWTLVDSFAFSAEAETDIDIDINLPIAGDYWLGFDSTHADIKRWPFYSFPVQKDGITVVSGRVFGGTSTATNWYHFYNLTFEISSYPAAGSAVYGPYSLPTSASFRMSVISWEQSAPAGTSVVVSCALVDTEQTPVSEDYQVCTNNGEIPNIAGGKDLYIKVDMVTSSSLVTPAISELQFSYEGADDMATARVFLTTAGRLRYPQGAVTVGYTASDGNLKNAAGTLAVPSFSTDFEPDEDNLTLFFNPNGVENLQVADLALTVNVGELTYIESKGGDEQVQVSDLNLSVVVYDTNNNPV